MVVSSIESSLGSSIMVVSSIESSLGSSSGTSSTSVSSRSSSMSGGSSISGGGGGGVSISGTIVESSLVSSISDGFVHGWDIEVVWELLGRDDSEEGDKSVKF